jgi:predicted metalloprotease
MRLDDLQESGNVEDRRGEGGGGGGFPVGGGGLGIGAIVVLGIVGWALGIDPSLLIGGAEMLNRQGQHQGQTQTQAPPTARRTGAPQDDMGRFVSKVLGSTELQWKQIFSKDGKTYRAPVLVLYRGRTQAQCGGAAQSAMGPFYCPSDQKVYLDTSFFDQIATRFRGCDVGSKTCQFSQAYVIAHEVGHHVQNLLGILPKAQHAQQAAGSNKAAANHIQVQVELQADCFAGVWANRENESLRSQGKPAFIEPGDIEAALRTAAAIGDDTLQKRSQGYAVPDSFTHGSSEQRQRWFNTGFKSGTVGSCNTFAAAQL